MANNPKFKKIIDYTSEELDYAIQQAVDRVPEFWTCMKGVDAYMEKRKRKELLEQQKATSAPGTTPPSRS